MYLRNNALKYNIIMTFSNAFDSAFNEMTYANAYVRGENGALAHATAASTFQDFYGKLSELFLVSRRETYSRISSILNDLFTIIRTTTDVDLKHEYFGDVIKMSLFIREPRSGKGERDIFYNIVYYMWNNYPKVCNFMVNNLQHYGYWGDFNRLYNFTENNKFRELLVKVFGDQLVKDSIADSDKMSLAGKWAPRENSKYPFFALALTNYICLEKYPKVTQVATKRKLYRKLVSGLNKELETVQVSMCDNKWSNINFSNVPSVAITNLTKAFQNEKQSPFPKSKRFGKFKMMHGKRCDIENEHYNDREKCRENFLSCIKDGKIKAAVTDLSKIIQNYLDGSEIDVAWEAQWEKRVVEIRTMIKENNLDPCIFPMIDLSSSMNGDPIIHAITMGLFTSMILDNDEDVEPPFANRFMSFASQPALAKLPRKGTLHDKMQIIKQWCDGQYWGGNTNIMSAIRLLLKIAVSNNLSKDEMPKVLAIFSDMQFDQGDRSWNLTSYGQIKSEFEKHGYDVPHVLFWNLRSQTQGYQVPANATNTSMVSGYSTRMLDLFISGTLNELQECDDCTKNSSSTLTLVDKALKHEMFEKINDSLKNLVLHL